MKQKLRVFLTLLLCAVASVGWGQTTYKLEQVTKVEAGGLYVFEQDGHVMINSVDAGKLQTTSTYSKNKLTGREPYVWGVEGNNNGYSIYSAGTSSSDKYLNNASSGNITIGTKTEDKTLWSFTFQNDNSVVIKNTKNSNRFLGYTTTTSYVYKTYAESNLNSGNYPHAIVAYKLVEESGDTPSDDEVATTTVIDYSGITNTDLHNGTAAGRLSVTVTAANGNTPSTDHPTLFSWSSSDESVATIAQDGTVTLVAVGTTTITASYHGAQGTYKPSSDTYVLTVTDSDAPEQTFATFNFPEMGYENQQEVTSATSDGVTVTFDKGTSSNAPKYYSNGTAVRAYGGNLFTISSDNIIKKIVITFGESDGSNEITTDVETYSNGTWTGSAKSVTFTINGSSGNRRIQKIDVTYEETNQSAAPQITGETSFFNETTVTITAAEGASIYYTLDGTEPTAESTEYTAPFELNATSTVKAIAIEEGKTASDVVSETFTKIPVMTVAEAIAYIETLGDATSENEVYVSGIVSQVDSYDSRYSSITYWISDDGTTATQMEVYSGKGLNGEAFNAQDDLMPGDEVVVCGKVKKYNGTPEFDKNNYLVSFKANRKQSTGLNYVTTSVTKQVGDANFTNELTNPNNLTVSYNSSNENVATVDENGEVTIMAAGTTTITASYEEDDNYLAGETSYTLTVTEAPSGETAVFQKVISTDDVTDGEYLIVYEDGALVFDGSLTTLDAVGNTQEVTISDATIETSTAYAFTISSITGGYSIKSASGKYIGQESDANGMATKDDAIANTISFDEDGNANIVSCGAYLRYNAASNQTRFRYYKSSSYTGQKAIQLYKKVGETPQPETVTVTISKAGSDKEGKCYGTLYYSDKNLVVPEGVEAYTYIVSDGKLSESWMYEAGDVIPAATGVVLKTTAAITENATYEFEVTTTEGEVDTDNMLLGTDEAATTTAPEGSTGEYKFYALSLNSSNAAGSVGFYYRKGCSNGEDFTNGAHKAYLAVPVAQAAGVKGFSFSEDTDGIRQIENGQSAIDNAEIYNLSGQRVQKAQKGIYIVNGKKVVVK